MLVIVFGLPGTGKTTLARELAGALEAVHLNTDMLRDALHRRDRYETSDKEAIYSVLLQQAGEHLSASRDVVVDGTFSREAYREAFRQMARQSRATLKWIRAMADEETIRSRVSRERPLSQADFSVYLKLRGEFEPHTEVPLEVWTDRQPLEVSLGQMLEFLGK